MKKKIAAVWVVILLVFGLSGCYSEEYYKRYPEAAYDATEENFEKFMERYSDKNNIEKENILLQYNAENPTFDFSEEEEVTDDEHGFVNILSDIFSVSSLKKKNKARKSFEKEAGFNVIYSWEISSKRAELFSEYYFYLNRENGRMYVGYYFSQGELFDYKMDSYISLYEIKSEQKEQLFERIEDYFTERKETEEVKSMEE